MYVCMYLFIYLFIYLFRCSAVAIVFTLQVRRSGVRIPAEAGYFSLLQIAQTVSGTHPASYSIGIEVLYRG
jgi:hypothetical protein